MLSFSFVLLMTKVAVPTCVELVSGIPTVLASTRKLILKWGHLIMDNHCLAPTTIQLLYQMLDGQYRGVKLQSLHAPSVGAR